VLPRLAPLAGLPAESTPDSSAVTPGRKRGTFGPARERLHVAVTAGTYVGSLCLMREHDAGPVAIV
jgi:hypothetical protein